MATAEEKLALSELYIAFFNRAPEFAGFSYWVELLDSGAMSLQSMATDWWNTQAETKSTYPTSLSTEAFVEKIYTNVLGRDTDAEGKAFWVDKIESGLILRENFIMSVIEGAKAPTGGVGDRQYLANKAEVGVYFAEQHAPALMASSVLDSVTDDTASVQSVKQWIERNFRPSLEELISNHTDSITIVFDPSMPLTEQEYILEFHHKITAVLDELTGLSPNQTFSMVYDPLGHRSWNNDVTMLKADRLPSQDEWFKSWYTVEVAHQYFKPQSADSTQSFSGHDNELRYNEYNSQTITSIIAAEYGNALAYNTTEQAYYAIDSDPNFFEAFQSLLGETNIFSIYQTNTNYAMNPTAIAAATHDLISLYKLDSNFYKNLLSTPQSWYSYEEYKETLASSIVTLSSEQAYDVVNHLKYFQQIDALENRPMMNLEIALFSSADFSSTTTNKQFALDTPDSYIIYGQSYNIDDNPLGTESWNIVPDSTFYNSTAKVTIVDANGTQLYAKENIDIKTDFANARSDTLIGLFQDGMTYTMTAEATINGVLLTDTLSFTYHL